MENIILKVISLIFIIFFGYFLKKLSFFKKDDYKLISKIAINITLPAATIISFQSFTKDNSLIIFIFLGIFCNLLLLQIGSFISKNKNNKIRALYMISSSGYNMGSFTIPFLSNILGPLGVIGACMFDTGNAPFCIGGAYAITNLHLKNSSNQNLKEILMRLIFSPAFLIYIILVFLSFNDIKIPTSFINFITPIGSSNTFLSMLMIGMMFEIEFKKEYFIQSLSILFTRYIFASIIAFIFYNFLPFSLEIRKIITIIMFAPISGLSPIFIDKCNGNVGLAGFISSISIIISVIIMISLLFII
ncbi:MULTISPECIES: AEC family transporter [Fusobacterium]|uniref:AEC family transporter n=1 Tax=Fusobacterium TaxID=848 RepID=UPI001476FAE0|nr:MULTISPECIES: AEC family transporter [Fusobacterium]NME35513.1 AEC family transporter [Fusobacterium sp. FSA-380-WT-3A]